MAATSQSQRLSRVAAGQWQPISNRATDLGTRGAGAVHTDFWRDRSD
jgi:hypothetical protein